MKLLNVFVCLIASAVFLLSGSAMATDRKVYPGSMCHPSLPSDANSLGVGIDGANNLSSTASIIVACPIVRDNTQNTNGMNLAFVTVKNQTFQTRAITCSLLSLSTGGLTIASKSASTTSNAPTSLDVKVNVSAVLGSYVISCLLPPGGRIISYDIDEF